MNPKLNIRRTKSFTLLSTITQQCMHAVVVPWVAHLHPKSVGSVRVPRADNILVWSKLLMNSLSVSSEIGFILLLIQIRICTVFIWFPFVRTKENGTMSHGWARRKNSFTFCSYLFRKIIYSPWILSTVYYYNPWDCPSVPLHPSVQKYRIT